MIKEVRITIRVGWIEEFDTNNNSMVQRQEEITEQLKNQFPPNAKLDIDIRNNKE